MPTYHRLRSDDDQGLAPAAPDSRQPDPAQAISVMELRSWMEAFEDNQLLAESKVFESQVTQVATVFED